MNPSSPFKSATRQTHSHSASPQGRATGKAQHPKLKTKPQISHSPHTHLWEGETGVPTHFPGDEKKADTLRSYPRVMCLSHHSWHPPSLEGAPNPLSQHVFFPSVTAAVRKALMSTLLPRGYWHLKSPKHHFCISNYPSIVCRVSWQTDDVLKTVVLLHSLKHVHTACGIPYVGLAQHFLKR